MKMLKGRTRTRIHKPWYDTSAMTTLLWHILLQIRNCLGHSWYDTLVRQSCGGLLWDALARHFCYDTLVGYSWYDITLLQDKQMHRNKNTKKMPTKPSNTRNTTTMSHQKDHHQHTSIDTTIDTQQTYHRHNKTPQTTIL